MHTLQYTGVPNLPPYRSLRLKVVLSTAPMWYNTNGLRAHGHEGVYTWSPIESNKRLVIAYPDGEVHTAKPGLNRAFTNTRVNGSMYARQQS